MQNQIDQLTKLPGSNQFNQQLNALLNENLNPENEFCIMVLDIDNFQAINDAHGMKAGDGVLQTVSEALKSIVKEKGTIYRGKADEFLVIMKNTEREESFLLFQEMRHAIDEERELKVDDTVINLHFTVSLGIASFPADSTTSYELIRKAKDALHRAKTKGKNRIYLAREEKMVTKTAHYTQGQLDRLSLLSKEKKINEAILLREALDDLIKKYDE